MRNFTDWIFNFFLKHHPIFNQLRTKIQILEQQNQLLKENQKSPKAVVAAAFARGIEWFDYEELPTSDRDRYTQQAKMILETDVFQNEMNFLKATGAQKIILDSNYQDGAQTVRDFQMTVNGYELLEERLKEIKPAEKQEAPKEPHKAI